MVFVDFFAVALVLSNFSSYYKDAGLSTKLYGIVSSVYAISQLIGSIVTGWLGDNISKRGILLVSFIGSGISYFIVGWSRNVGMLIFSRVLVGLVKQTMSISTILISEKTADFESEASGKNTIRANELAHLSAIASGRYTLYVYVRHIHTIIHFPPYTH